MKKVFMLFALIILGLSAFAQNYNNYQDVVYLKNGSVIKGIIIEQTPNVSLKIQTKDGSIFVYQMTEVEKMTKEQVSNQKNNPKYNPDIHVTTNADSYRNPAVAWVCSFLVPGIGQFYNGQPGKGVGHLLWYLGSYGVTMAGLNAYADEDESQYAVMAIVGSASMLVCWIVSQVDASRTAHNINEANNYIMSFNLSKKVNLALSPEVRPVYMPATNSIAPSYGAGIKLSF
jgi:hypothetical protein